MSYKMFTSFLALLIFASLLLGCGSDEKVAANDVINAFEEAGLETHQPNKMTRDD